MSDNDQLVEMVNLRSTRTGIAGVVFISTAMASHGPRIKWFPKSPENRNDPCLTVIISDPLTFENHNIDEQVANNIIKQLFSWVDQNKEKLLDYWFNGWKWDEEQLIAFYSSLKK